MLIRKKIAIKLGFLGQETAAQGAASTATVGIKGAETMAVVSGNAAQAGAGAAASQAAIPIIGPALAMASMAAIFASVMALGGKMKSARRGYDIPKGMNPLVQTHEEEMILPSEHANTMRRLAEMEKAGALGGGEGGGNVVNYHDHSGRLSDSEIRRKAHVIAQEMSRMNRNFYWTGKK